MSFINWGSESPEQLKIRREMEERIMFEQASYSAAMAAAAASAGGSLDPLAGLYGVAATGLAYSLGRGESNWSFNYPPFPSITQATLNTDDGLVYATVDFEGEVSFVRIDRTTRELEFIENDISDYAAKGASSLYYEGEGNFIYLDNFFKKAISSIIRVTLGANFEGPFAYATQVSEVDPAETGYLLRNLFLYEGATWAIAIDNVLPQFITGPFNIETGEFTYSNVLLPSPSEPNIQSIDTVFGVVEHKGVVYVDAVWVDSEDNSSVGLFKMDTDNGGAVAPYYLTFVKDLLIESAENVAILSITSL